jgi:hypothetical protein
MYLTMFCKFQAQPVQAQLSGLVTILGMLLPCLPACPPARRHHVRLELVEQDATEGSVPPAACAGSCQRWVLVCSLQESNFVLLQGRARLPC